MRQKINIEFYDNNNNDVLFYTLAITRTYIWFSPQTCGKYFMHYETR